MFVTLFVFGDYFFIYIFLDYNTLDVVAIFWSLYL